jgi:hypothetical protein
MITPLVFWNPVTYYKNYGPKVFLLTNIQPEYSDILYNPIHFAGPLACRIRQAPLYVFNIEPHINLHCKIYFTLFWNILVNMVCFIHLHFHLIIKGLNKMHGPSLALFSSCFDIQELMNSKTMKNKSELTQFRFTNQKWIHQ